MEVTILNQAPKAPGSATTAASQAELQTFILEMQNWVEKCQPQLDGLDQLVAQNANQSELLSDLRLTMTLWQNIKVRLSEMIKIWDLGRVSAVELKKITNLIWSRLDINSKITAKSTMPLSLVEACELLGAMAFQLSQQLDYDPDSFKYSARIESLHQQLERLREHISSHGTVQVSPDDEKKFDSLVNRLASLSEKKQRRADVAGLLASLEHDCAFWERDLIISQAQIPADSSAPLEAKDSANPDWEVVALPPSLKAQIDSKLTYLSQRRVQVSEKIAATKKLVQITPNYAIPDASRLPKPTDTPTAKSYLRRLEEISHAYDYLENLYMQAYQNYLERS